MLTIYTNVLVCDLISLHHGAAAVCSHPTIIVTIKWHAVLITLHHGTAAVCSHPTIIVTIKWHAVLITLHHGTAAVCSHPNHHSSYHSSYQRRVGTLYMQLKITCELSVSGPLLALL